MRRAGTRYVSDEKSSSVKGRLKRFIFSVIQAYMLELGASVMRFYRHQGQITVADTTAVVTNGTFPSGITDWDDVSTGSGSIAHDATNDRLTLTPGGTGATDIGIGEQDITTGSTGTEHVLKFRVLAAPGDKIEFQVGTATGGAQTLAAVNKEVGWHCVAFTPTTSPFYIQFRNLGSFRNKDVQIDDVSLIDDSAVEIDTPWAEAALFDVHGPQTADVLYQFHETTPTYKLQRFGHTTWSLVEVAWQDGPYLDENTTTTTLTPSASTGLGINLTLSSIVGVNDDTGWQSTDIGRLVRYKETTEWGYAIIVSITSTTVAVADVRKDFEATPTAKTTWRIGKWSETTGYPQVATFFEQRLYSAGSTDFPQSFWASQTADFENMKPDNDQGTVEADDAIDFTLSADSVNAIRWLSAGENVLTLGTTGGEWVPFSTGEVITPLDITVRRQTTHGSAAIQPVRVGHTVLFVQRAKRKIREFSGVIDDSGFQSFQAPDMTRLAQHITKGGIVEMDYAEEPDSLVWAVRNDGQLLSMTLRRDEDAIGWTRHILGGQILNDSAAFSKVWQVDASGNRVDETEDANDAGNADWTVFPATEAVGDSVEFAFPKAFAQIKFDYANGTAGVAGVVAWEYETGKDVWTAFSGLTDNTTGFTVAAADGLTVKWTLPTDWVATDGLFHARARITTVYTTNPVLDQGFIQGPEDAVVESVAVIPGANGSGQTQDSTERDEVWMTIRRTINGATKRHIEVLEGDFETGDDQEDAYYVDSMLTYDGASATVITGAGHLEAETVRIWADGAIVPDKVVASGQFTLDTAAQVVQFGLPYKHKIKTLRLIGGNPAGTRFGKTQRIVGVTFGVLTSHTIEFGPTSDKLQKKDMRVVSDPMDAGAPLFTGLRFFEFEGPWSDDTRMVIESDDPTPFTLLALAPETTVNPLK